MMMIQFLDCGCESAFLQDAGAEYRNADDSVNDALCGSGCGTCPSGTSDTRCSVGMDLLKFVMKRS